MSVYRKIPTSPSSSTSELRGTNDTEEEMQSPKKGKTSMAFSKAGSVVCIICTFANLLLLAFLRQNPISTCDAPPAQLDADLRREDVGTLRRPSQFIRFDEIVRPSPPIPRQFNNYPILIAQIDQYNPEYILGESIRSYLAGTGTVSPESRRVLVTRSVRFDLCNAICNSSLIKPDPSRYRPSSSFVPLTMGWGLARYAFPCLQI